MAKFHINDSGDAGLCRATKGGCPFGGDDAHYASLDKAREVYEEKMSHSSLRSSMVQAPKDMYITVFNSYREIITENLPDNLGPRLEPGEYIAQYRDSVRNTDQLIRIRVGDDSSISYENISRFKKLSSATSKKTLDAISEAQKAYREINMKPVHCIENMIDRVTLIESAQAFERVLLKHNLEHAEGIVSARIGFEDLEWSFDGALEVAQSQGLVREVNALKAAKAPLSKLLNSFRS